MSTRIVAVAAAVIAAASAAVAVAVAVRSPAILIAGSAAGILAAAVFLAAWPECGTAMTAVFAAPARLRVLRPAGLTWHEQAACQDADPERFFPEKGCDLNDVAAVKAVCRACPVREQCLRYALTGPVIEWGIWGGFTERVRRGMAGRCLAGETLSGHHRRR